MAAYRRRRRRSVHFRSDSCEWSTPQDFFAEQDALFGFTLDVCATPANTKCERFFTREQDGLLQPWTGRVWCNPPYGAGVGRWLERAWQAVTSGEAEVVVCLVPARTDTTWWHTWATRAEVEFLRGRLRFGGGETSAPFPSALLVFRNAPARYETQPRPALGVSR
jgi:site-specific DNA-methyltransferase (adenine-specific)